MRVHRPEFVAAEGLSPAPHPLMGIDDLPLRAQSDKKPDHDKKGKSDHKSGQTKNDIEKSFNRNVSDDDLMHCWRWDDCRQLGRFHKWRIVTGLDFFDKKSTKQLTELMSDDYNMHTKIQRRKYIMSTVERTVGVGVFGVGVGASIVLGAKAYFAHVVFEAYSVLVEACEAQRNKHFSIFPEMVEKGCYMLIPEASYSPSICHKMFAEMGQGVPLCYPEDVPPWPQESYKLVAVAVLVTCLGLAILINSCFNFFKYPIQCEKSQIQGFCRRKQIEEQPRSESGSKKILIDSGNSK
jgi:hypothetical protein